LVWCGMVWYGTYAVLATKVNFEIDFLTSQLVYRLQRRRTLTTDVV
jgi:hypothetical protein